MAQTDRQPDGATKSDPPADQKARTCDRPDSAKGQTGQPCRAEQDNHGPKFPANLPPDALLLFLRSRPTPELSGADGKAPLRSPMHNPRPLERPVGRPLRGRKPGLHGFCFYYHFTIRPAPILLTKHTP